MYSCGYKHLHFTHLCLFHAIRYPEIVERYHQPRSRGICNIPLLMQLPCTLPDSLKTGVARHRSTRSLQLTVALDRDCSGDSLVHHHALPLQDLSDQIPPCGPHVSPQTLPVAVEEKRGHLHNLQVVHQLGGRHIRIPKEAGKHNALLRGPGALGIAGSIRV